MILDPVLKLFGVGKTIIFGAVLAGIGFAASGISLHLPYFFFTYSIIAGDHIIHYRLFMQLNY